MKKKAIALTLLLFVALRANPFFCSSNDLYDSRDMRCYKTVTIGNQTWMSENLTYREDLVGKVWLMERISGYHKIAVFYTWRAAMNACPDGWHLPSVDEWETLFYYVAGEYDYGKAIKKLKSESGWSDDSGNGSNDYGFSAYPVGMIYKDGTYMNNGGSTHFWTSTSGQVAEFPMASEYGGFNFFSGDNGFSVRCVED